MATWEYQGIDDTVDSNIDRDTFTSGPIILGSAETNTTIDAGFIFDPNAINSIGDKVWLDTNTDGVQQPGDPGIAGVTVELLAAGADATFGTADDPVVQTAVTGLGGDYLFASLPDGHYQVRFVLDPANPAHDVLQPTWPHQGSDDALDSDIARVSFTSPTIDLDATAATATSVNNTTIDAGFLQVTNPASIGDTVWLDANADGIFDATESAIPGVVVQLLASGADGVFGTADDVILDTIATDSSGQYLFSNLVAGQYQIAVVVPTAMSITFAQQGSDITKDSDIDRVTGRSAPITLIADEHRSDIDAGLIGSDANNSIGNHAWNDANHNGIADIGEANAAGITVELIGAGPDGLIGTSDDVTLQSTATDANGDYHFDHLPDGIYAVRAQAPTGQVLTFTNQDSDDTTDSDIDRVTSLSAAIDLDSGGGTATGITNDTTDIGVFDLAAPAALGDHIWLDANTDGIQDGSESGIEGVSVSLIGAGPDATFGTADDVTLQTTTSDAAGDYHFNELPAGDYQVRFGLESSNPAHTNLVPTWTTQGTDTARDSNIDRVTQSSGTISLAPGTNDTSVDAGYLAAPNPSSIGDLVWNDSDGNGMQDAGESGIAGVVIELIGAGPDGLIGTADDLVVARVTTDASGAYEFANLPAGDYLIHVDSPTGWVPTWPRQGADTSLDSDIDRTTLTTHPIALGSNQHVTSVDIGLLADTANNSIGDTAFVDVNSNGRHEPTETGVSGVAVLLIAAGPDGVFATADDVTLDSTTTASDGTYSFTSLPDGEYQLRFVLNSSDVSHTNLQPTWERQGSDGSLDSDIDRATGQTQTVSLDPLGSSTIPVNNMTVDAGYFSASDPGSIGDRVWDDANHNGVDDPGEFGIAGVRVELLGPGPDGAFGTGDDVVLATVITDSTGPYLFAGLPAGDYRVKVTDPAGFVPTFTHQGVNTTDSDIDRLTSTTDTITLSAGQVRTDIDAGFIETSLLGAIGDFVWNDVDGDGIQDLAEPGINGVTVVLLSPGPDGALGTSDDVELGTIISGDDPTTPDLETGWWAFTNLPPGEYGVKFTPTGGWVGTHVGGDINPLTNSDADPTTHLTSAISVTAGQTRTDIDAGFHRSAGIGDKVWLDSNRDGRQDANEPGVAGVRVWLLDGNGNKIAETTTDANGMWSFTDLAAGVYQISFDLTSLPEGYMVTGAAGGCPPCGDALDNDADPATGATRIITLGEGEFLDTLDAGIRPREFDLALTKTLDPSTQGTNAAVWDLVVTNLGPDTALGPIVITDELPSSLAFTASSADGWICTTAGQTVTCSFDGNLEVNQTLSTLHLSTDVVGAPGEQVNNSASVAASGVKSESAERLSNNRSGDVTIVAVVPTQPPGKLAYTGTDLANLIGGAVLTLFAGAVIRRRRYPG